ncbi:MAG TPA: hypothetical protein DDX19_01970 [Rhodopirellula baltica]|uniref:DUF7684 domain-containing protein n=1 Tax=Rhodopirellula baltica (strain DSM 10527 / NCIMB 13988 / SH1) TaxID=243090 RepID=Q7UIL6_RHOBA|nr:hypothetical protein [Rhodopirellula baltica]CAD77598.1 hypothetical protein RB12452 [Rhodopirellula baltica SH 1]HBE61547.1 hypothetical protein [Rhodopirellula baltica]
MRLIAQQGDRRFWFLRLKPPYDTAIPDFGTPFVAIVLACDPTIAPDIQAAISAELVAKDCRYVLAWGVDSSSWDDSVDWAFIATDPEFNPPNDRMVMTTCHDNETIDDVICFALRSTNFGLHKSHDYLALMIGNSSEIESDVLSAIRSKLITP